MCQNQKSPIAGPILRSYRTRNCLGRASKANVYVIRPAGSPLAFVTTALFKTCGSSLENFGRPDGIGRGAIRHTPTQPHKWRIEMIVGTSRRIALVFATLAVSAIALAAPAALAASPVHAKPAVQSAARVHAVGRKSTLRASRDANSKPRR